MRISDWSSDVCSSDLPREFMVAVLNNYGGFYNRKVYVNEAKQAGAIVRVPCVNQSLFNATIYGKDIYLGFDCLLNLDATLARRIPAERQRTVDYPSLEHIGRTSCKDRI